MAGEHEVSMPTKAQIRETGSSRTPACRRARECVANSFYGNGLVATDLRRFCEKSPQYRLCSKIACKPCLAVVLGEKP